MDKRRCKFADMNSLSDIEWFDAMCNLLRRDNKPTVQKLLPVLGPEKPNPHHEIRGGVIRMPYDTRFDGAVITPDPTSSETDQPINSLFFWGQNFRLRMTDLVHRFKKYETAFNSYDGGTQIFFYLIPNEYEFSALDFWTDKEEKKELRDVNVITFHSVTFQFGEKLLYGRTGYFMKREDPDKA
jgi:hypothetical protein